MVDEPVPIDEVPVDAERADDEPIIEGLEEEISDDMISDREEGFVRGYRDEAASGHAE